MNQKLVSYELYEYSLLVRSMKNNASIFNLQTNKAALFDSTM